MASEPPPGDGRDRAVSLTENSSDARADPTAAMTPARDGEEKPHRAASIFGSFGHFGSPSAVTPSAVLAEPSRPAPPSKSAIVQRGTSPYSSGATLWKSVSTSSGPNIECVFPEPVWP